MTSTAIIVLGMHRSGTSALAGVLSYLGVALGENLLTAESGINERGFWEHVEVLEIHEALLGVLGSRWHDILPLPERWWKIKQVEPFRHRLAQLVGRDFSSVPIWAVKDPRMCRLAPLWLEALDEVGIRPLFIHIHRDPHEVARSLERRDEMAEAKGLFLWLDHNLWAERWSRGYKRVFISYPNLLDEPRATIERIGSALELTWPRSVDEVMKDVESFLTPQLRHHVTENSSADKAFGPDNTLVAGTLSALDNAVAGEDEQACANFASLFVQFNERVMSFDPVLLGHIRDIERHRAHLEWRLELAAKSFSMRITRPLRTAMQTVRHIAGKRNAE